MNCLLAKLGSVQLVASNTNELHLLRSKMQKNIQVYIKYKNPQFCLVSALELRKISISVVKGKVQ